MYGWVVSNELVREFEPAWIENDNVELEKYDYVCASWEDLDVNRWACSLGRAGRAGVFSVAAVYCCE